MRSLVVALAAVAAVALAGCGSTSYVQERPVLVSGGGSVAPQRDARSPEEGGPVQVWVVTHGQASSPFWAIVRNGVESAARQLDVQVTYRAPDVYSLERQQALIEQAIRARPDGLVVSLPEPGLAPAVRDAVRAGIPVVSINSGSEEFRSLHVLAHVGQPEERAGLEAGRRLAAAGARRTLCVNQQVGNQGLDARCAGMARALRAAGGRSTVIGLSDVDPRSPGRLAAAIAAQRPDGILTLNSTGAMVALKAVSRAHAQGRVRLGTFDLGPDVLAALERRRLLFAIDQQPFLQGYLPVVMLAQRARYGLFPAEGDVVATGPHFVTPQTAPQALRLSRQSIR